MKRLPQFTSLLAVVALSVSLAYWAMQLFKAPQRPINPPPVPVVQDASVEAGAALFGGQVSVATASNYQLRGVVAPANGRGAVAILATDGQPAKAYPVGVEVAGGVKVQEVQERHVVLLEGGIPKRIDLPSAIRMLTVNPAAAVGLHDRGAIETGRRADLVLVRLDANESPAVELVIRGGQTVLAMPRTALVGSAAW